MAMDGGPPARVLVVDDLKGVRQVLRSILTNAGYEVLEADGGQSSLDLIRAEAPDAVLLDIRMPGLDGFQVLERAAAIDPRLPVVMVTAYGDIDTAVDAMHRGAYHYLSKPFHHAEVLAVVERAVEHRRLSREILSLHERLGRVAPLADELGTSPPVESLLEQVDRVAVTDEQVLVRGEAGSGKELVARAIHARSARRHGPFVAVDCGAVPADLLEGELFGHAPGEAPDAGRPRPGQLDLAAGGTLYLADVGTLPLAAQGRLLGFLAERKVQRVGGEQAIPLDVRVIAATGLALRELVDGQLFQRDLYERLGQVTLVIPPLRERPDDIVFLLKRLLDATNQELGKHVQGPTPEALDLLLAHPWPGNLRELRHVVRRAVLLAEERIEPPHLALAAPPPGGPAAEEDEAGLTLAERRRRAVERVEAAAITDALRRAGGNKRRAAKLLGIGYKTLHAKIRKHRLQASGEPDP